MKEYIECRDSCYSKADEFREQWSTAMDDCQNQFDSSLQACFELEDNDEFMTCYRNANTALQNCKDAADSAYDEGMDEVAECVEECKTKFEDCSKQLNTFPTVEFPVQYQKVML